MTGYDLHPSPGLTAEPPELMPFPERGNRRPDLDLALAAFLTEESAALDERRYSDWLDALDEMFIYQVPVPLLREDPDLPRHSELSLLFEATKNVLAMKLGRVELHHAWSDRPSGIMRHFVGSVRVFDLPDPGALRVDSNVLATFSRGLDETGLATAGRQDIIAATGGSYRLLRRRVLLDAEVPTWTQLSIIFLPGELTKRHRRGPMSGLAWQAGQRKARELCRIVCESAAVTVAAYPTGNGLRLHLISERSNAQVLLDATVLEALCHLSPHAAAELVRACTEGDTESPGR